VTPPWEQEKDFKEANWKQEEKLVR
jgi:hypothetical protein